MTYRVKGKFVCIKCGNGRAIGRKLCRKCYWQAHQDGTLKNFPVLGPTDVFELRIKKTRGCWLWTGTKNQYGYGVFLMPGERPIRAHRYSYELFVGKIPPGKIIMHSCDNPPCVNPRHLSIGTKAQNNKDTGQKRRHNYGLNHWNGKLSDSDVQKIMKSSERAVVIAKQFGINRRYVYQLKSRGRR